MAEVFNPFTPAESANIAVGPLIEKFFDIQDAAREALFIEDEEQRIEAWDQFQKDYGINLYTVVRLVNSWTAQISNGFADILRGYDLVIKDDKDGIFENIAIPFTDLVETPDEKLAFNIVFKSLIKGLDFLTFNNESDNTEFVLSFVKFSTGQLNRFDNTRPQVAIFSVSYDQGK